MRRKVSLTTPGLGTLLLIFPGLLLGLVAQQPPLVAASTGALALVLLNIGWGRRVVGRVEMRLGHRGNATVGQLHFVQLRASKPVGVDFQFRLAGGPDHSWHSVQVPVAGPVATRPSQRGVFNLVESEIRTSFPLGLTCYRSRRQIVFDKPLHVAPPAVKAELPQSIVRERSSGAQGSDEMVSLRAYEPGDQQRDIHWQSVARTGTLIVRERGAAQEVEDITVVVDLSDVAPSRGTDSAIASDGQGQADLILGTCRYAVEELLRCRYNVILVTAEAEIIGSKLPLRPVSERVASLEELSKRLARAAAGHDRHLEDNFSQPHLRIDPAGLRWVTDVRPG